jgi:hypothetical protein
MITLFEQDEGRSFSPVLVEDITSPLSAGLRATGIIINLLSAFQDAVDTYLKVLAEGLSFCIGFFGCHKLNRGADKSV